MTAAGSRSRAGAAALALSLAAASAACRGPRLLYEGREEPALAPHEAALVRLTDDGLGDGRAVVRAGEPVTVAPRTGCIVFLNDTRDRHLVIRLPGCIAEIAALPLLSRFVVAGDDLVTEEALGPGGLASVQVRDGPMRYEVHEGDGVVAVGWLVTESFAARGEP